MNPYTQYLSRLPYFEHLTEEQKTFISDHWVLRRYARGQIIHGGSVECLGQIMVLRGEARSFLLSEEGREITLFRLAPREICVLSASCVIRQITFDTQIVAESDCEILVLHSGAFSKLTEENIYVKCFMYELLTERFSGVMWTVQQILFLGFDRRLAYFLLSEYERTGSREIRMTHEQIAQHTSSAREVVARMLKRFSADGLVTVKRGVIALTDLKALEELQ